jgi:hypothetical protein
MLDKVQYKEANTFVEMTNFLHIIHRLSLIKDTRRFGDWSLSPSSGKKDTYNVGPNRASPYLRTFIKDRPWIISTKSVI